MKNKFVKSVLYSINKSLSISDLKNVHLIILLTFFFLIVEVSSVKAFQKNNVSECIQNYQKNPDRKATTAEQFFCRAMANQQLGNKTEALRDYTAVLSLEPQDQDTYANRCGLLSDMQRYEEALLDCKRAIKIDESKAQGIQYNLGVAQEGLGEVKAAMKSFKKASDYAERKLNMQLKDKSERRLELLKRVQRKEITVEAVNEYFLASDKASTGELDQALSLYELSLSHSPGFADAHFERGNIFALQKHFNEALSSYEKAEQLNPALIALYNNRAAVLLEYKNDYLGALRDLTKASNIAQKSGDKDSLNFLNRSIDELKKQQEKK